MPAIISAVGIGDSGAIEYVEDLDLELGAVPLLEREGLENGEVPVLEAVVAEDVPAHGAEVTIRIRSHDRVAVYVAATLTQRTQVGGDRRALGPLVWDYNRGVVNPAGLTAVGGSRYRVRRARAVGNGIRAGLEIEGVPEEIPPIRALAGPAEIVGGVAYVPRLGALNRYDGVDLPAFQH